MSLEKKEFDQLVYQVGEQAAEVITTKVTEATKGMATQDSLNKLKETLSNLNVKAEDVMFGEKSLKEMLTGISEDVAKMQKKQEEPKRKPKSTKEALKSYIEENAESWERFRNRETLSFGFKEVKVGTKSEKAAAIALNTKAAGTMLVSTNTNSSAFVPRPVYEGGLIDLVRNRPFLEQFSDTATTTSPRIIYTEKVNPDGEANFIGEGVVKPLIDFEIQTTTVYAKKVADKIKVSTEMLDDIDFMAAEIDNELRYQVDIHTDDELLAGTGDGTESNADLKGLTSFAGGYTLTTVETKDPNNFDAIRACAAQITSLNFSANYAFVNPIDAANMDLEKATDGHYIIPPFKSATGMEVAGIRVVESNQIPVGYLLVGDMTRFKIRNYMPFAISMGWVNDDFEKNLVTIIGERRLTCYVPANHTGAFVYDAFSDIKTAITSVGG